MVLLTTNVVLTGEKSPTELVQYNSCYLVTSGLSANCVLHMYCDTHQPHMELRYVTPLSNGLAGAC